MTLGPESTVRELMERSKVSLSGSVIAFRVDDLNDDEFDRLYDLMDEVFPEDATVLTVKP